MLTVCIFFKETTSKNFKKKKAFKNPHLEIINNIVNLVPNLIQPHVQKQVMSTISHTGPCYTHPPKEIKARGPCEQM